MHPLKQETEALTRRACRMGCRPSSASRGAAPGSRFWGGAGGGAPRLPVAEKPRAKPAALRRPYAGRSRRRTLGVWGQGPHTRPARSLWAAPTGPRRPTLPGRGRRGGKEQSAAARRLQRRAAGKKARAAPSFRQENAPRRTNGIRWTARAARGGGVYFKRSMGGCGCALHPFDFGLCSICRTCCGSW